jgi:hypothetical protein
VKKGLFMKRHPSWFAAGLLVFVVLACNFSKNKNVNVNRGPERPADAEVYTEEVYVARDKDGPATSTLSPSDRTVHVVINLNKAKTGTDVKVTWLADDVAGTTNKQLKTLEYTTKSAERKIPGYLTWSQDWQKGRYRVEVYIDGRLDRTVYYDVE